jgi:hypothetical protein
MRVFKYRLHEGLNAIPSPGTSKLVMLEYQDRKLHGWVLEVETDQQTEYEVYIAVTGEQVPDNYQYVTSTQTQISGGYYVVHAFD